MSMFKSNLKWSSLSALAVALALPSLAATAASAQQAYRPRVDSYYALYNQKTVDEPVVSSSTVNRRDPYHLPESYNFDWPYGEGLSH